jgi:hypothetical protein
MATMFCALCARPVDAKRQIGAGTIVLAIMTFGFSLLAIPLYRRRCSICQSPAVSFSPPASAGQAGSMVTRLGEMEQRLRLVEEELEAANVDLSRLKAERDFYSQLLESPARGALRRND